MAQPKTTKGMYMLYLDKMQLREEDMHPDQKIETERAFYGGLAAAIVFIAESDNMEDLTNFHAQVKDFWAKQMKNG